MFNRIVGGLWITFLLLVGLPARGADYVISRDQLVIGDRLRDWAHIWTPNADATGAVSLISKTGQIFATLPLDATARPAVRPDEGIYRNGFAVPADLPEGEYKVAIAGRDTGCIINVTFTSPRRVVVLYPSTDPATNAVMIENNSGPSIRTMLGGSEWRFARKLNIPAGSHIGGIGATFRWTWPDRFNGTIYHQNGMAWGDGCTFADLTIDLRNSGFLTWNANGAGTVFDHCTFRDGQLGNFNQLNGLLTGCQFIRAGAGVVAGGTWIDCTWDGLAGGHAFLAEQGHRLLMLQCRFFDTDRGPYLRSGWSKQDRTYIGHIHLSGQSWVDNGNELISSEGTRAGLDGCIFYGIRAYSTEGQLNFWQGPVRRCKFIDGVLDGPSLIFAAIDANSDQSDNLIERWELRGGSLIFGDFAKRNRCVNVACVNPKPTRANQFSHDHKPYDPAKLVAIGATRPDGYNPATDPDANVCEASCKVTGNPTGSKTFSNVKVLAP